jgi:predicted RNase H-like HicB family nuclease
MEIPVWLEPLPDGGFQARSADPLGLTAQGDTPDAALQHLRDLIQTRAASGAILTSTEVPTTKYGESYL